MKSFALVLLVALASQTCDAKRSYFKMMTKRGMGGAISECPIKDCYDNFWKSYQADKNQCSSLLVEADTCYAKLENHVCECSMDEAFDAHAWSAFLREIYSDSYCNNAAGCVNSETQACMKALGEADEIFYTGVPGEDPSNKIQTAIDCVENDAKSPYDVTGCGWDISTLKSDRSMFVPLWKAWSEGCDVHALVDTCKDYIIEFEKTICTDAEFDKFASCMIDEYSTKSECSSLPTTAADMKEVVFGDVIADRCPVYNDVMSCYGEDKKDKLKRILNMLELLTKSKK